MLSTGGLPLRALSLLLPWSLRRRLLNRVLGYEIDPAARIGFSWTFPRKLIMGPGARIGHLNVVRSLEEIRMDRYSLIGQMNWFTDNLADGEPGSSDHLKARRARFHLGEFAAVTSRHYFDCSDSVEIHERTVIGGYRSQFLTHSYDFGALVQDCLPISIGPNSFVGTNCLLLGGSTLPPDSMLAGGSVLVNEENEPFALYAGNPARKKKVLDRDLAFFNRSDEWLRENRSAGRRWMPAGRCRWPGRG